MANAATTNFGTNARHVVVRDNLGNYFLIDRVASYRFPITGAGQLTEIQKIFGPARTTAGDGGPIYLTGWTQGKSVVDLYGGPGGIEQVTSGQKADPVTGRTFNPESGSTGGGGSSRPGPQPGPDEGGGTTGGGTTGGGTTGGGTTGGGTTGGGNGSTVTLPTVGTPTFGDGEGGHFDGVTGEQVAPTPTQPAGDVTIQDALNQAAQTMGDLALALVEEGNQAFFDHFDDVWGVWEQVLGEMAAGNTAQGVALANGLTDLVDAITGKDFSTHMDLSALIEQIANGNLNLADLLAQQQAALANGQEANQAFLTNISTIFSGTLGDLGTVLQQLEGNFGQALDQLGQTLDDLLNPEDTFPYAEAAAALYPWLTPQLLETYAEKWSETGNAQVAMAFVRQSPTYDSVFAGNRRADGSLRLTEEGYFSEMAGFREALTEFGFNPDDYAGDFTKLIEGEVDARELLGAAQEASERFTEPGGTTSPLAGEYISNFFTMHSRSEALEATRGSSTYGEVFAGNRREDGTLRMDEQDYFAYKRGWQRTLVGFGLNPEEFESRGRFLAAVEGEVSVQELGQRLQATQDGILDNIEQVQQFYAENYGLELTPEAILGASIDPGIERDLLERRIQAGQIGGEAALQGFARSIERAEELARAGLGQGQARDLYSKAGRQLPGLSAATQRHNRGAFGVQEYENTFALGQAKGAATLEGALRDEQSSFSSTADTRRDQMGALTGLRQR